MTAMEDLKKLKVADLRDELTKRGLETKGVKDELIARLWESMSAEQPDASSPAPENASDPVVLPPAEHPTASTEEADVPAPAKAAVEAIPAPPAKLSEAEKNKLRAERFGLPVAEGAKDKPAASSSVGSLGAAETHEEVERRKKRAERFGMPVPMTKEEEWAKKKQRAAKFGLPAPVFKEEEEAKRQSRQSRFGAGSAVGGANELEVTGRGIPCTRFHATCPTGPFPFGRKQAAVTDQLFPLQAQPTRWPKSWRRGPSASAWLNLDYY